jgi:hypothetical protein
MGKKADKRRKASTEAFRPSKRKVFISVGVVVIWYGLLLFLTCSAFFQCPTVICVDSFPMIIPLCNYCCYRFGDFIGNLMFIMIIPFTLVYLVLSLNRLFRIRKGKK